MNTTSPILIVVVGPTAVGKTSACISLAKRLQAPIISADSRQFYREMHIGTAKPTTQERQGVPHYFIDNLSIEDYYSVGDYEREVLSLLNTIFDKHPVAILTGGSGLFIKAVCEGIDDIPELKEGVREVLMEEFASHGLGPLLEELAFKDPEYYKIVDQANHARVIRALEVIRSSGQVFSQFRQQQAKPRSFKIVKIGLVREREELYNRINERVDQMMQQGLLEEVQSLLPYKSVNSLQTVGYQELFDYLEGQSPLVEAVALIKRNTRRYAKRQLTWFKKDAQIRWFHPSDWLGMRQYLLESAGELKNFLVEENPEYDS